MEKRPTPTEIRRDYQNYLQNLIDGKFGISGECETFDWTEEEWKEAFENCEVRIVRTRIPRWKEPINSEIRRAVQERRARS